MLLMPIFREARSTSKPRWNGVLSGFHYILSATSLQEVGKRLVLLAGWHLVVVYYVSTSASVAGLFNGCGWGPESSWVCTAWVLYSLQISFNDALAAGCSQLAIFEGLPLGPASHCLLLVIDWTGVNVGPGSCFWWWRTSGSQFAES